MLHSYNLIYIHPQPILQMRGFNSIDFFHLENDRLAGACVCVRVNGIVLLSLA